VQPPSLVRATGSAASTEYPALEEHHVDEVAFLGATDERRELVREDLVRRIDQDVVAIELVRVELGLTSLRRSMTRPSSPRVRARRLKPGASCRMADVKHILPTTTTTSPHRAPWLNVRGS
jgi:hypothetical protein